MAIVWSPFDIKLMLHHHCCLEKFEYHDSPIYPERLQSLIDNDLLERDELGVLCSTPRGKALVEMWCAQPLPVATYIDPRLVAE
jgi:hypothetical protein